jgi:lantibiotic modifying enzyme
VALTSSSVPWSPVLSGDDAKRASETVAELAVALSREQTSDPALASGAAGIAVFLDYAARVGIWQEGSAAATALLREAVAGANEHGLGPDLYGGILGTAWAVVHTQPPGTANVVAAAVDSGLASFLERLPDRTHFDLISGLVGHGVYALERLPEPGATELVERIVERLAGQARPVNGGIAWASDSAAQGNPAGARLDLGLAHGTPGVIALLASCHTAGIARRRVEELVPPAVAWLLSQRLDDGALPYWVEPGTRSERARTAWCYGDPGVALAVLRAARALGRDDWERAALEQAEAAAVRPADRTGVQDCGLCHGALGLAHLFGRLFAATDDVGFAVAARDWIAWGLDRRVPDQPLGGFLAVEWDEAGRRIEREDPGLLTGAAGVGLALAAAASSVEPAWDRVMLVSGPPRRAASPT